MKIISKILSICAVLALIIACAVFSVSAETDVRTTFVCPCSTCVETRKTNSSYTCPEISSWKSLTAGSKNTFADGGHYYVYDQTITTGQLVVSAGNEAVLLIDKATVRYEGTSRMFSMNGSNDSVDQPISLHIIGNNGGRVQSKYTPDTGTEGVIAQVGAYDTTSLHLYGDLSVSLESGSTAASNGGLFKLPNLGRLYIHDNANMGLTNANDPNLIGHTSSKGSAIYLQSGSPVFYMEAGTITGGTTSSSGNVINMGNGTATITGSAQITGGTCGGSGGIIYMTNGDLTISGNAQLTGTTANYGGIIYGDSSATVEISGNAQLSGGNANNYGGAIYSKGKLDIKGGTITGGSATHGGTLGINGGPVTINGGTINGGTATTAGGTIYMHTAAGTVNIQSGANINGGNAANGGMLYMAAGELNMTGGTVSGGIATNDGTGAATGHGGCFYLAAGSASFTGGTITGGKTVRAKDANGDYQGGNGGSIYAATDFEIDGTSITGGTCRYGGVAYVSGCTLSLKSGTIKGGSVTSGAVFYLASSGKVNMTGGTVNNGTISSQGTLVYVGGGTVLNMTGGTMCSTVSGDESGIRVQGSGKVYLHGQAHVMSGAGGRNAVDLVGTGSTPATLVLAGNAKVSDLNGKQTNVHNITLQAYTNSGKTYYPRIRVANDWTGYATITDNFGSTASGEYICVVGTTHYAECGTWDATALSFTKGGTFASPNLIHGGADEGDLPIFGEDGYLMLPRAKAIVNGTTTWHRTADEAADTACKGGYAVLYKDDTAPITLNAGDDLYMDFNGFTAPVNGEGTLYGLDSSALATGAGTSIVTFDGVTVKTLATNPATGDSYIAIKNGNTATFHAVTANITSVSIRPGTVGMYYSAQFVCDDTLKTYLDSFGIAVSLQDMPGADFATDKKTMFTRSAGTDLASGEFNSVLIQNIMTDGLDGATNKSRGEMPIYANAYMNLTIDGEPITILATNTSKFSLKTLLQHVNTYWDTFAESAQTSLATKIYEPYVRDFEDDDWDIYNIRIQANGGYTAEEKAILEERRQTVMDYMRESVSLLWRSDKTITYGLGNTERDKGASFTIEKDRLYKGLPYVYGAGTQDAFLEYAGEPDENGIYTITGIEATALNYESYGGRVGNDCSGAVTNAWSLISTTLNGTTSSACHPYYGVVPVGNYAFNSPISETNRLLDTKYVVDTNGEQVMYEAYAMLKPADAAFHQEYPSTKGNHIRMVVSVNVVRNEDGTIDGTKSTITMLEQTRTQINANKTEKHPVTGETIYVIGGVDKTYKFSTLFGEHYIPVTIKELRDPSPVEETWVDDTLEVDTIDNLFTGSITSNRYLDSVRITIYNENGEIVQQTTGRRSRSVVKEYKMERFLTEKQGSMIGILNKQTIADLEPGNYRCTVTVKLTIDDDYIHTARDFTFSK